MFVQKNNLKLYLLKNDFTNQYKLDGTYKNSIKENYQNIIGMNILKIVTQVKYGGILAFFPSYRFLNLLVDHFKQSNIYNKN